MDGKQEQREFDFERDLVQNEIPEYNPNATIQERFELFHELNPHVYMAIVSYARERKRQGRKRLSMKLIIETLREKFHTTTRGDKWKINNNYTAPYARLVMQQESDLDGLFELREPKAAKK